MLCVDQFNTQRYHDNDDTPDAFYHYNCDVKHTHKHLHLVQCIFSLPSDSNVIKDSQLAFKEPTHRHLDMLAHMHSVIDSHTHRDTFVVQEQLC